ncbi:MAG: hypothetical protein EON59_05775, partial [Alphaproteobacteria bacterium]
MKTILLVAALSSVAAPAAATEVIAEVELLQTGESAKTHNPACGVPGSTTTADMLLHLGAAAVDAYVGQPVGTQVLKQVSPGNRDWVKGRLGIHDGKSTCATVCVSVPRRAKVSYQVCMSETGRNGKGCTSAPGDLDPPAYANIAKIDTASTDASTLICATGKNWSHNRNRWL